MYGFVMEETEDSWNPLFGLLDPEEKDITLLRNVSDLVSIRHVNFFWNLTLQEYHYETLASKNKIINLHCNFFLLVAHSNAQDSEPDGSIQSLILNIFKYFSILFKFVFVNPKYLKLGHVFEDFKITFMYGIPRW